MKFWEAYRNKLFILFWAGFCFGLSLSPALISISLAALGFIGLINIISLRMDKNEKLISAAFLIFYFFSLVSAFYSDNTEEAQRKLILKLPLLIFPLLLTAFKSLKDSNKSWLYGILAYSAYLPASVSVYNYFSHKAYFDILILQSKPLPVEFGYGVYHIQFSVFLALVIIACLFRIRHILSSKNTKDRYELIFLSAATAFNFIFIHILSARTGLLSMYFGLFIFLASLLPKLRLQWKIGLLSSALLLPLLMYLSSASLRNRIENTITDMKIVLNKSNPNDYSFAMRVEAWKNAADLIKNKPLSGYGIGDAEAEIQKNYRVKGSQLEPQNRKNPHFQLLETCIQSGILSGISYLLIFAVCFLRKFDNKYALMSIALSLFLASCFESILERQASISCFAVFLALFSSGNNKE